MTHTPTLLCQLGQQTITTNKLNDTKSLDKKLKELI